MSHQKRYVQVDWLIIEDGKGTDMTFAFLLVSTTISGIGCGILESSLAGLSIYLPSDYYHVTHDVTRVHHDRFCDRDIKLDSVFLP